MKAISKILYKAISIAAMLALLTACGGGGGGGGNDPGDGANSDWGEMTWGKGKWKGPQ